MHIALKYLTTLALLAVFLVLLAGLWNMMRGTSPNLQPEAHALAGGAAVSCHRDCHDLVYLLRS